MDVLKRRGHDLIISVMQPGYLPWLGFFELMNCCEKFVIYDDVDYDKNSWRNRNRIRTADGFIWLSVPVLTKGRSGQKINEVEIFRDQIWQHKHYKSIVQNYSKSPHFKEHQPFIEEIYNRQWAKLIDLDMEIIHYLMKTLAIKTKIIYSSELNIKGRKTQRLVAICKELNASVYISTNGAESYIEPLLFERENIAFRFQDYQHPTYSQLYDGFISHLSVIDLIFNHGSDALGIIMSGSSGFKK